MFFAVYPLPFCTKNLPQVVSNDPAFQIIHLPVGLANLLQEEAFKVKTAYYISRQITSPLIQSTSDRGTKNILLLPLLFIVKDRTKIFKMSMQSKSEGKKMRPRFCKV